jgi:hypothetical protein
MPFIASRLHYRTYYAINFVRIPYEIDFVIYRAPLLPGYRTMDKVYRGIHACVEGENEACSKRKEPMLLVAVSGGLGDRRIYASRTRFTHVQRDIVRIVHAHSNNIPEVRLHIDHDTLWWCEEIVRLLSQSMIAVTNAMRGAQNRDIDVLERLESSRYEHETNSLYNSLMVLIVLTV